MRSGLKLLTYLQFRRIQILKSAGIDVPSRNTAPPGGIGVRGMDLPQYVLSVPVPCGPFANLAQDFPLEGAPPGNDSRQSRMFGKSASPPPFDVARRTHPPNLGY